jgi:hypothetical protein
MGFTSHTNIKLPRHHTRTAVAILGINNLSQAASLVLCTRVSQDKYPKLLAIKFCLAFSTHGMSLSNLSKLSRALVLPVSVARTSFQESKPSENGSVGQQFSLSNRSCPLCSHSEYRPRCSASAMHKTPFRALLLLIVRNRPAAFDQNVCDDQ